MAALAGLNTFMKGMNSDVTKINQDPNSYVDALNFRPLTELGSSNSSLVNIRGNEYQVTIPDTLPVYKIRVKQIPSTSAITTITINGVTSNPISASISTTGLELYNLLSQMAGFGTTFQVAYDNTFVVIWSTTTPLTIFLSSTTILDFVTKNAGVNYYVEGFSNLQPIGSTFIRENIYILTTNETSNNPTNSGGQIWKLNYDKINNTTSLTLLYSNYINLTTAHPVPYTAILSRYENGDVQRIYWTDNFNKLRQVNVVNPNLMALEPSLLDIVPARDMFTPTLSKIDIGGSLKISNYQITYRLKKDNGQVTSFSPMSNMIPIYNNTPESITTNGNNWSNYFGDISNILTSKKILFNIRNLDVDFDRIDIAVVKKDNINAAGECYLIAQDVPIPTSGDLLDYQFDGNEDTTPITLEEIVGNTIPFTHCKTITTKDNRLFPANVRNEIQELDNYDARAYRFDSTRNSTLINNGLPTSFYLTPGPGQESITTLLTNNGLNEENDAINPNQDTYKYKSDGVTIGGEGPNISYEFANFVIKVDETIDLLTTNNIIGPWRRPNQMYKYLFDEDVTGDMQFGISDMLYPQRAVNDSFKNPYKSYLVRGYMPNETYRFGVQFYDKQGSPYYVKWIADIQMPDYSDPCNNQGTIDGNTTPVTTDHTPVFTQTLPGYPKKAYMNVIHMLFKVDVPANLKDKISGFEIVRVQREDNDKTILGTGLLYQCMFNGAAEYYAPVTHTYVAGLSYASYSSTPGADNAELNLTGDGGVNQGEGNQLFFTFDAWDFQVGTPYILGQAGDKLRVKLKLARTNSSSNLLVYPSASLNNKDAYGYAKFFDVTAKYTDDYNINKTTFVGRNDRVTGFLSGGYGFTNRNDDTNVDYNTTICGEGLWTCLVETSTPLGYISTYNCDYASGQKLFCHYVREANRQNQYGGNTYAARSGQEYISCGSYVPVTDPSIELFNTIQFHLFGGDTFFDILDNQKVLKNGGNVNDRLTSAHYKPHLGFHHPSVRYGEHIERVAACPDFRINIGDYDEEDFNYNTLWSLENNIKKFFTKPVIVNETEAFDNRVHYSEVKINGETADSWSSFKAINYWDVEGSYGPINSILTLQDKMYYLQDRGFGMLAVNPVAAVTTDIGDPIILGKGDVIQRHYYVATDVGTVHQWSVNVSQNSIVWVDALKKKIYRFSEALEPISDLKGTRGFTIRNLQGDILVNDNPIKELGIHTTYDYYNNEFLITFLNIKTTDDKPEYIKNTIVFSEPLSAFSSFYSFTPKIYINNDEFIFTPDPNKNNDLYIHNIGNYGEFYGILYPSSIKTNSNHNSQFTKIFNNLTILTDSIQEGNPENIEEDINMAQDTFNEARVYNDYQNTDWITLDPTLTPPTIRRVERSWNLDIPRNKVLYSTSNSPDIFTDLGSKPFGERMRDKYAFIDLKYNNDNNYRFIVHSLKTLYLVSDR